MDEMMAEKIKKRKDWTKIEVETIKRNMPRIISGFIIIISLILSLTYMLYLGWINLTNINQDANSGITIEHKNYEKNITNITEEKNIGIETQIDDYPYISNILFSLLPFIIISYMILKIFVR